VRELYRGPSASAGRAAAEESGASWYLTSAGMGLVHSSRRIPSYDLTIARSGQNSSVLRKIRSGQRDSAQEWWKALTEVRGAPYPIRRLIKRRKDALIVLAVSTPYLQMIDRDLIGLSQDDVKRIRIITANKNVVPNQLRTAVMPYDARLNSRDSPVRGPMVSFVQRAAWHFLRIVAAYRGSSSALVDADRVRRALATLRPPIAKRRRRVSDRRLIKLATKMRSEGIASAHMGLRVLRKRFRIACAQSRFARIWQRALEAK